MTSKLGTLPALGSAFLLLQLLVVKSSCNLLHNPVIFVPGDGGSQLEARLNKSESPHYICEKQSDWFDLWLNVHLLAPVVIDCLGDNMRLYYNRTSRTSYNTPGVEIRPTKFGSLDSVTNLDIWKRLPFTDYFKNIADTLEERNGLKPDSNMMGAAFDFRKAPNELAEFFTNLTTLIEETYAKNNYAPVTLICHSMGCLNSLYLLNRKPQQWKDVFVRRLISLAAPWDGSFKAISAMLFGDNLGIPLLSKKSLEVIQSTFPSLMYLFPKNPTFPDNRVLVQSDKTNFTLTNLDNLFQLFPHLLDAREMWHDTRTIAANLTAPGVELWCLYGAGVETPSKIVFKGPIEDGSYEEEQSDGDGTVNVESLRACERFASQQQAPVYTRMFDKTDHIDILRGKNAAEFISSHILPGDQDTD